MHSADGFCLRVSHTESHIYLWRRWVSTLTGLHDSPGNLVNIFETIKAFLKSYFACIQSNHYNANEIGGMANQV